MQQLATSLTHSGTHMLHVITQCYPPPDRGDVLVYTPAKLAPTLQPHYNAHDGSQAKRAYNEIGSCWRLSRLMPATADERCADANIFACARNTVCVRRRLQRIGIQSYHRRRRQLRDITTYKCPQLNAR